MIKLRQSSHHLRFTHWGRVTCIFVSYLNIIGIFLTHWGRVMHICVGNLTIIGSDNGLSPGRRQAIIWTNAGILLIGPPETNFSEMLIGIHTFSFKKIHSKMLSGKWWPFCLGLNVLMSRGPGAAVWQNQDLSWNFQKYTKTPDSKVHGAHMELIWGWQDQFHDDTLHYENIVKKVWQTDRWTDKQTDRQKCS